MLKVTSQLLKIIIPSLIIILCWSIYLLPAQAVMPSVYLIDFKIDRIDFQPGETIKGSFVVFNNEKRAVNDITYKYLLFIKDETGIPKVYIDEKVSQERFNLSPGEKRTFSYSYNLPQNILSDRYTFRIALLLSGLPLGWEEKEINIIEDKPFLLIDRPFIIKNDIEESAVAGINFEKGETARLKFRISNPTQEPLSATPEITIYERTTDQTRIESLTQPEITLELQETLDLIYDLPLYEKPESYLAELQFFDKENQSLSNKLFFRWVVIGLSGEIIEASTDKESYQEGEEVEVNVFITGPADIVTEPGEVEVITTLLSPDNIPVGTSQETIDLSKGYHTLRVSVDKDVSHPIVKVELKKGNIVLDDYQVRTGPEFIAEKPEEELPPSKIRFYLYLLATLIILGVVLYYLLRKRRFIKIAILLIFIGGAFLAIDIQTVKAAVDEFKQAVGETYIENTYNKPKENEIFVSGGYITFQGAFFIPACMDALVLNRITFYITDSQHQPTAKYWSPLPTSESEKKKKEILKAGNSVKLGSVFYVGVAVVGLVVEYNRTFKIPDNVPSDNVYARVWFEGAHWDPNKNKYNMITSESIITNSLPTAAISCDASDCKSTGCTGYTGCPFHLINKSTDPDGNSDIVKSEWDVLGWGGFPDLICIPPNALCKFTPQPLSPGDYTVKLTVADSAGQSSDTATGYFKILQEAIADFKCSLDNSTWQDCENIELNAKETVYFLDQSSPSERAGVITNREWIFEDGDPVQNIGNETNPLTHFQSQGPKKVTLIVTDNRGRTVQETKVVSVKMPLPRWREAPPVGWLQGFLANILSWFRIEF